MCGSSLASVAQWLSSLCTKYCIHRLHVFSLCYVSCSLSRILDQGGVADFHPSLFLFDLSSSFSRSFSFFSLWLVGRLVPFVCLPD